MTLQGSVALAFYRYAVALDVGLSALTGAKDDVYGIPFSFRHIAFVEFLFISDLYYLEAFLDEVGRELPQFFKVAVAVEDSRKIFGRVVGGDPKIVRHSVFSFAVYCCICTVLNIIISVITKNIAVLPDIILYSLFYPVIVQALILPVIYKLGVEKGRAAVIIVLCLAIMLYIFLSTALTASSIPVFAAVFIVAAAAGAVSFNISLTILKKQEF